LSVPRRIEIDNTGDLSSWPDGFFDAQDLDSLAIVRAIQRSTVAPEA
jgi:predicted ATPase